MILTIRSDKPEAEIAIYDELNRIDERIWHAHKELSVTLLSKIDELVSANDTEISAVVVYEGPGSFTGLRIGFTVAKTLAYAKTIPLIASGGDDWQSEGVQRIIVGDDEPHVLPNYGREPNITQQKK